MPTNTDSGDAPTLRELLQMEADVKVLQTKLIGMEQAVQVAHKEMERRLDSMNRLREEIQATKSENVSRSEWSAAHESMEARLNLELKALDKRLSMSEKMLWMGLGALAIVEAALRFLKG
jgi:hypothetical protein